MKAFLQILKHLTGEHTVYPFYHAVADDVPVHLKHLYNVRSKSIFESDVEFFKSNYDILNVTHIKKKGFFITFDDGLREFKDNAWPILKANNIPTVLFVNSAFVDNKAMFFRFKASLLIEHVNLSKEIDIVQLSKILEKKLENILGLVNLIRNTDYTNRIDLNIIAEYLGVDFKTYLETEKPYLTIDELKQLNSEGVIIGAHSVDHPLFHKLNLVEQLKQLTESCEWVEENFNQRMKLFSFPFTDFGLQNDLFEYMFNEIKLQYSFGTAGLKKERYNKHIQRIPMENNLKSAKQIIFREYLYYLAKAPFFKNTIRR